MSGPRQVSRIAHKARRLLTREGYGARSQSRRKPREPFGPVRCGDTGKLAYVSRLAADAAVDRLVALGDDATALNVYECPRCHYLHVGHKSREGTA